jgi:hypothetical protein
LYKSILPGPAARRLTRGKLLHRYRHRLSELGQRGYSGFRYDYSLILNRFDATHDSAAKLGGKPVA